MKNKTIHEIKILSWYAAEYFQGLKPWELRKNDRDYKKGDYINFTIVNGAKESIGLTYMRKITNVHSQLAGLESDYVILTIAEIK